VRRFLLFAGLALMWFALFQDLEVEGDPPGWGMAVVLAMRFLADLVGAWLAVTILRLAAALTRLLWARLRAHPG
jgi:hypothetical protein